jgi:taurine dioxygenase
MMSDASSTSLQSSASGGRLAVRRLSPALGAEVVNFDPVRCTEAQFRELRNTWEDAQGLLVIRDAHLAPAEHIAFGARFGEPSVGRRAPDSVLADYYHPQHPEIYRVSNKVVDGIAQGREDAGTYWHSDGSHSEIPPRCCLLHGIEIPPYGGDTQFASMTHAYDALSDTMKHLLSELRAVHTLANTIEGERANSYAKEFAGKAELAKAKFATHPVVRIIPETGRKALFVNPGFTASIVGMTPKESAALLAFLFAHCTQPEFIYRHKWSRNDLVIWDNRCTMHYAVSDYKSYGQRYMHRVTIKGEAVVGA